MNKNIWYKGIFSLIIIFIFFQVFAEKNKKIPNGIVGDSIKNSIIQIYVKQTTNAIQSQNIIYNDKTRTFYVLNTYNNSLDIIDYAGSDTIKFLNKINLSEFGNKPVALAMGDEKIGVAVQKENVLDSCMVVFFETNGTFIRSFSVAPSVNGINFDEKTKKIYISNFSQLGYKVNIIDYSKGLENISYSEIKTLTYEKEKAAEAFIKLDPNGIGMTMIAMSVVFFALIFLYLVFRYIGKLNTSRSKKKSLLKQGKVEEAEKISEDTPGDVYAAIAMALHLYQNQMHDEENTVITIEKVARNYSPWSSKIYGLRQYHKN